MQEFFYTILAIWVIWKIFGAFSRSNEKKTSQQYYQQTNHHHHHYQNSTQGQVRVEETSKPKTPKSRSDEEYVDFEEIK